jgi:hypothetical protein
MKFFLLVFDILFAFDEPSSIFPARISILLRVVVVLKPSGDGALILLLEEEEEEEEETARALVASFDQSVVNEEDERAINARICVCMCMYVYVLSALINRNHRRERV